MRRNMKRFAENPSNHQSRGIVMNATGFMFAGKGGGSAKRCGARCDAVHVRSMIATIHKLRYPGKIFEKTKLESDCRELRSL